MYCSAQCRATGPANGNWKGGRLNISQRIRQHAKSRTMIAKALRQGRYTCQQCGQVGGELEVDHIRPFSDILSDFLNTYAILDNTLFAYELSLVALKYKPFWDVNNLRVLCRACNWRKELDRKATKHKDKYLAGVKE